MVATVWSRTVNPQLEIHAQAIKRFTNMKNVWINIALKWGWTISLCNTARQLRFSDHLNYIRDRGVEILTSTFRFSNKVSSTKCPLVLNRDHLAKYARATALPKIKYFVNNSSTVTWIYNFELIQVKTSLLARTKAEGRLGQQEVTKVIILTCIPSNGEKSTL